MTAGSGALAGWRRRLSTTALSVGLLAATNVSCSVSAIDTIGQSLVCTDLMETNAERTPEIRLVMLYSSGVANPDIEQEIEVAVMDANVALLDSEIRLTLVIAHMEEVTLTDEDQPSNALLNDLIAGTGPLMVAHTLRETHRADVVGLVRETSGASGESKPMVLPSVAAVSNAFFWVRRAYFGEFVIAHEIGHLLGGVHQDMTGPSESRYRYANPFVCTDCRVGSITGWRTIMASNGLRAIGHFSNPDVRFGDVVNGYVPTGIPLSDANPADNRRTFTQTGPIVSGFRMTPVWFASAGAGSYWYEKRVAEDVIPDIGLADFDGDRETDAFKVDPETGGWLVSYSASGPWQKLRDPDPFSAPQAELRFADFKGDGKADVFYANTAAQKWYVSDDGVGAWVELNASLSTWVPVQELAFGEFSGDAMADVFRADQNSGAWYYSSRGESDWIELPGTDASTRNMPRALLGFGHFDSDSRTDVFYSNVATETWMWSSGGAAAWATLQGPNADLAVPVWQLALGDFDGDGITDVIRPTGSSWSVSWKGAAPFEPRKLSCIRREDMGLGDFDGDRVTDVLRSGFRP